MLVEMLRALGPNHVADILVNELSMKGMAAPTSMDAMQPITKPPVWLRTYSLAQETQRPKVVETIAHVMHGLMPYFSRAYAEGMKRSRKLKLCT